MRFTSWAAEYVDFVWKKVRVHGNAKSVVNSAAPKRLEPNIPILGPRFVPPNHLHAQRRRGEGIDVNVDDYYLKALTIVHPFYSPELA